MIFKLKSKYKMGDIRIKSTFLFFPKRIEDEIRWLCFVKIKQSYYEGDYHDSPGWLNIRFVD